MLKKTVSLLLVVCFLAVIGCAAHIHKVGNGPQGNEVVIKRQWYLIAGLAPLNEVDTHALAGDATDYEIRTEMTVVDAIITFVTSWIITPRTVTVRK